MPREYRKTTEAHARRVAKLPPESEYEGYPHKLEARRMYVAGYLLREIADHFGKGKSTIDQWIRDPQLTETRKRKSQYDGPCADCGKTLKRSGPDDSGRCLECHHRWLTENKKWTRENIIAELQAWAREIGRTPVAQDALVAGARVACNTVQTEFGTWALGLDAAGLETSGRGRNPRNRHLNEYEEQNIIALYRTGRGLVEVGEMMDVSAAGCGAVLKRHGVNARDKRQRLSQFQEGQVVALYRAGKTWAEIHNATGISTGAIGNVLRRRGLSGSRRPDIAIAA